MMDLPEYLLVLEPRETFDQAILGVVRRADGSEFVLYDQNKCIDLVGSEWFWFNTFGSWVGEYTPGFLDRGDGFRIEEITVATCDCCEKSIGAGVTHYTVSGIDYCRVCYIQRFGVPEGIEGIEGLEE